MKASNYLSFDIGGTNVKWGLLDDKGEILQKGSFSSNDANGEVILTGLKEKITFFSSQIQGVAISSPGFIQPSTGYIEKGGAILEFDDFHLQDFLEKEFSIPVSVENDVNCVALAEKWQGNAKSFSDFICLTVGTGIGGALFLNNQLYRGYSYRGGEFGYMITNGLHSNSSETDGLSAKASIPWIREQYASYKSLSLSDVTGEMVFQAYDEKDPIAFHIIESFYQTLAIGIYNITSVLNPEKVLIGGGITSRPTFIEELQRHLTYVDQIFHIGIDSCHFKNDAGLVGALAFHKIKYCSKETETI